MGGTGRCKGRGNCSQDIVYERTTTKKNSQSFHNSSIVCPELLSRGAEQLQLCALFRVYYFKSDAETKGQRPCMIIVKVCDTNV